MDRCIRRTAPLEVDGVSRINCCETKCSRSGRRLGNSEEACRCCGTNTNESSPALNRYARCRSLNRRSGRGRLSSLEEEVAGVCGTGRLSRDHRPRRTCDVGAAGGTRSFERDCSWRCGRITRTDAQERVAQRHADCADTTSGGVVGGKVNASCRVGAAGDAAADIDYVRNRGVHDTNAPYRILRIGVVRGHNTEKLGRAIRPEIVARVIRAHLEVLTGKVELP